ncbi:MAG: IclR family transcriptional regulator [Desulfobacteraceae bacterium]|nr:MAG: IclR family transcriptional regulator [Desulfobacteraceae bacterium]
MEGKFKRVPALDKCFAILDLMAHTKKPLGISDLSNALAYHKSTVFNMVYTLVDLGILENGTEGKFRFGPGLYALGKASGGGSELVSTVHPYLEEISKETKLSVFLGIRSGKRAVIMDKVDSPFDIKVSSEAGMAIPLLAGAGGKVLLSQLSDAELNALLSESKLKKFTPASCTQKQNYKNMIQKARKEGFALDDEEYIEGVRALAVPLHLNRGNLHAAIWVVGLKSQIKDEVLPSFRSMLKDIARRIEIRFS